MAVCDAVLVPEVACPALRRLRAAGALHGCTHMQHTCGSLGVGADLCYLCAGRCVVACTLLTDDFGWVNRQATKEPDRRLSMCIDG